MNKIKKFIGGIQARIKSPRLIDIFVSAIITLITFNFVGEIVSRPINGYLQALVVLGFFFMIYVLTKMIYNILNR